MNSRVVLVLASSLAILTLGSVVVPRVALAREAGSESRALRRLASPAAWQGFLDRGRGRAAALVTAVHDRTIAPRALGLAAHEMGFLKKLGNAVTIAGALSMVYGGYEIFSAHAALQGAPFFFGGLVVAAMGRLLHFGGENL